MCGQMTHSLKMGGRSSFTTWAEWLLAEMQVWIPTKIEEAAKLKVESLKVKEASNKVSMLFNKEYFIQ